MLGKVDRNHIVHIKKSGWWIEIQLERGTIRCTKCGTDMYWDKNNLQRR